MPDVHLPQWQLPPGVTRGVWEYAHSNHIADDYDAYFAHNKLFEFDQQVIACHFGDPQPPANLVADFGCGTGRALLPLVRRGFRGLAIDISQRMLDIVRRKAETEHLAIECVQTNMVEADSLADDSVDHAICLFSTLGMIRGRANRQQALSHMRRILKPGGVFVLHVHNYWYNLYDPGGPWWLVKNVLRSLVDRDVERGDKFFHYRGVSNMFLHVFTRREISRALRRAGFGIRDLIPLDAKRHRALGKPWWFSRLRANGWIIVCD